MKSLGSYSRWPTVLCFPLGVLAAVLGRYALTLPVTYDAMVLRHKVLYGPFLMARMEETVEHLSWLFAVTAGVILLISVLGLLVQRGWVLSLIRKGYILAYIAYGALVFAVMKGTWIVLDGNLAIDEVVTNPVIVFFWRYNALCPGACAVLLLALLHILSWCRVAINCYAGARDETPAMGDRILEDFRTHGPDPEFRKSVLSSVSVHLLVIIIVPWMLSFVGCATPYRPPDVGGDVNFGGERRIKIAKRIPKKYILSKQSVISFKVPTFDVSKLFEEVQKETELTHVADPLRVFDGPGEDGPGGGRRLGSGKKNGPGGWPDGSKDAQFRFIRMEYSGSGWADGMDGVSRADMNFLDAFRKMTRLKTATSSESHGFISLGRYPKGYAPPFVYMTGDGDINVSSMEMKALREYLMDGGLLFADCGSTRWDSSFRGFIKAVLPGRSLCAIADDDPLFKFPFSFVNGAPPIWHHGGRRALGIKSLDRWIVFYHPGDINDAWKTGHSGLAPDMWKGSIEMGVNIVYYSFTHYLEATRRYRKK